MPIANAVQRGMFVYVYDENNRHIASLPAGDGSNDGLKGYTASSVNIQRGGFIYTYDVNGRQTGAVSAR
ncbi:MAG: hypothetical protein R6W74_00945 [Nitrosomonas halophila]